MNAALPLPSYIGAMTSRHTVEERRFVLYADGREVAAGTCSPDALHALVAGRLLGEGLLVGHRVAAIDIDDGDRVIALRADLRPATDDEQHHDQSPTPPIDPPLAAMPDLFRELFRCGDERYPHGGVHVAALSDGERLLHVQTDIGRHNAVDKTLGAALLIDTDVRVLALVLSARVSGEIARKAAAAGVAWIATRSVPTTLALDIAQSAGIPIVARAPARDAFVWQPLGVQ